MIKQKVCSYKKICDELGQKKIVCFGAGNALSKLFSYYKNQIFLNNIQYILDNDSKKWNTDIEIDGRLIKIRSLDYLIDHLDEVDVIVISSIWEEQIIAQLNSIDILLSVFFYSYNDLKEVVFKERLETAKIEIVKTSETPIIPKVIHYCWFGGNPMPKEYKEWMKSWKKNCPDYEILEWNETNYDYKKNKYMYDAYKAGKYAFVSDYARLDIIYSHGGIYLDTDVEVIKNLDDFLYQKGFGGYQCDGRFATGLGIGAIKGLPFVGELLNSYDTMTFQDFKTCEERRKKKILTCPDIQTGVLKMKGYLWNNCVTDVDGFCIYPAPVFDAMYSIKEPYLITKNTYLIHHYSGSWVPKC